MPASRSLIRASAWVAWAEPGVRRHTGSVLAGQHPTAERRVGQHAQAQRQAGRDHLALEAAIEQGVPRLVGHDGRAPDSRPLPGRRPGRSPAVVVGHPDVPGPARVHRVIQGAEGLLESPPSRRCTWTYQRSTCSTPDAAQRTVQRVQQLAAGCVDDGAVRAGADPGLGGDDDLLAGHHVGESCPRSRSDSPAAYDAAGVDQRAAGVAERDELGRRLVGVGLPAPGHRAQAEVGNRQSRVPYLALLHSRELTGRRPDPGAGHRCVPSRPDLRHRLW